MNGKMLNGIAFGGLSVTIAGLAILLLVPTFIIADLAFASVPFVTSIILESEQYEPVISFKEKYPDYTKIIPEHPNQDNVRAIYQYHNASLNRTESLSIIVNPGDGVFASLQCEGHGGKGFALRYYTEGDVDGFKCANYSINSENLQRLLDAKNTLEQSDIPIDYVKINYETQSLYIIMFDSPQDINNKKINNILLKYNIPASVAYRAESE